VDENSFDDMDTLPWLSPLPASRRNRQKQGAFNPSHLQLSGLNAKRTQFRAGMKGTASANLYIAIIFPLCITRRGYEAN
jgi:hypothetical protein